jgi:hypothetical protein
MSQFTDDLTSSGAPLRDDDLVAYLLIGLDEEYNPIFTSVDNSTLNFSVLSSTQVSKAL